jgi:ATP-dependent Zn protease
MARPRTSTTAVSLDKLNADIESGFVRQVDLGDADLTYWPVTSIATGPYRVNLPQGMSGDWNFVHWLMDNHNGHAAAVHFDNGQNLVVNLLLPLIPWLLIFGFIWVFVFRRMKDQRGRPMPVVIVNPEALP